jgi:hypothetical protein
MFMKSGVGTLYEKLPNKTVCSELLITACNALVTSSSQFLLVLCGPGSVVGTATAYGVDGPGVECRWGRDFPHLSRPALRHTQPPVQWYRVFPGGKGRPGRDADPSPTSSAEVKNTVELYLYSP